MTIKHKVPKLTLLEASLIEGEEGHMMHVLLDAIFHWHLPLDGRTFGPTQCSSSHVLNGLCLEIFTSFFLNW